MSATTRTGVAAREDVLASDAEAAPRRRDLRPLSRLLPFLLRYPWPLAGAGFFLVVAATTTLVVPLAVRRVIDHGFSAANAGFIDSYFGMMIVIVAVLAIASAGRFYFVSWIGERLVADLREQAFRHLLSLSAGFYEKSRTGELLSRLTADTTQLKSLFGSTASVALRNFVMMVGAVVMMVVTSPRLSGLVLLAIPFIVLPLVLYGRRVRGLSRLAQDMLANSAALAQESLSYVAAVQANVQERRVAVDFAVATEEAFVSARRRTQARALLTGCTIFMLGGSVVGVLWYGAQDVLAGNLTAGTLGQFVLYAALAASSLGSLSEVWGEVQLAAGAAERLSEILDAKPEIVTPALPKALPEPSPGTIAFRDVRFSYPTRGTMQAMDGVSFEVASGETVALVGPSGAGKSTIFSLLLRFHDPLSGKIEIDGIDIAQADPAEVRARIGLVPQETVIFSSTIGDNIRFGRPEASDAEVQAAVKAARVDEFVDLLPQRLDTAVGERGVTLSGGQRQRIAIARAILRDAPILLLDEATSALDAESETAVQEALERLMVGRTSLVIAHRLATVRNAHRIIVLDAGRIVAQGTHNSLMQSEGLYARLARLQFVDAVKAAE